MPKGNFCDSVLHFFCIHYRNIVYMKIYRPLIYYTLYVREVQGKVFEKNDLDGAADHLKLIVYAITL